MQSMPAFPACKMRQKSDMCALPRHGFQQTRNNLRAMRTSRSMGGRRRVDPYGTHGRSKSAGPRPQTLAMARDADTPKRNKRCKRPRILRSCTAPQMPVDDDVRQSPEYNESSSIAKMRPQDARWPNVVTALKLETSDLSGICRSLPEPLQHCVSRQTTTGALRPGV